MTDPDDPRLEDYRDLRTLPGRTSADARRGVVIVEGRLALERVLDGGPPLRSVLLTPSKARSLSHLLDSLASDVEVLVAERDVLRATTGVDVHRGVLASARRPPQVPARELLERLRRIAVLVGLNDGENLGAVFRTSASLGMDGVLVDPTCGDPLSRRAVRVSLGWSAVLPHARLDGDSDLVATLRGAGLRSVALTPAPGALDVDRAAAEGLLDDPVALVVGPEGPGLDTAVLEGADVCVRIPMATGADSLNVATALGVVAAFAAARRSWS